MKRDKLIAGRLSDELERCRVMVAAIEDGPPHLTGEALRIWHERAATELRGYRESIEYLEALLAVGD